MSDTKARASLKVTTSGDRTYDLEMYFRGQPKLLPKSNTERMCLEFCSMMTDYDRKRLIEILEAGVDELKKVGEIGKPPT